MVGRWKDIVYENGASQNLRPTIPQRSMDSEGSCFLKNLVVLVVRNCPSAVLRKFYFRLRRRHSNFWIEYIFETVAILEIGLVIYQADLRRFITEILSMD
ncbi:hypothetical protein CEXT_423451 [Caerostris extrusa]|uniref:Uncharacterized protein n=1 Tax=Caerostris extrusa TaxID=172846 RepID=A0AAV4V4F0_CAEEX|nr:hypothetical protein CEXT_423451 [Caerostris extrusa]